MKNDLNFSELIALCHQNCRDAMRLGSSIARMPRYYVTAERVLQQARNCIRAAEVKLLEHAVTIIRPTRDAGRPLPVRRVKKGRRA